MGRDVLAEARAGLGLHDHRVAARQAPGDGDLRAARPVGRRQLAHDLWVALPV